VTQIRVSRPGALGSRLLEDGRELVLYPMIFNVRLCIGDPQSMAYDEGWCFHDRAAALSALLTWEGEGDPPGYFKRVGE
jgi:hypothetical protein